MRLDNMALSVVVLTILACLSPVLSYQVMSQEPYSLRDSFLRILGESKLLNPMNRYDYLLDEPTNLGFHAPRERQYSAEVGNLYQGGWPEESDAEYFDRVTKGEEQQMLDDDYPALANPITRDQEYLQHSSLWGHQYIQGGAGEGNQILKTDGSQKVSQQEMKTDAVLPAYCDPPNPCPVGFTAEDGCLEDFENTAAFSREYQEAQDCLCDAEHMFGCGDSRHDGGLGGDEGDNSLNNLLTDYKIFGQHKTLVAKKFHTKKSDNMVKLHENALREKAAKAAHKYSKKPTQVANEFLAGEKLPIAAKKGMKLA